MWSRLSQKIRVKNKLCDDRSTTLINAIKRETSLLNIEKNTEEARLLYMMGEQEGAFSLLRMIKNKENLNELSEVEISCYLEKKDHDRAVFLLSLLFTTEQLDSLFESNSTFWF